MKLLVQAALQRFISRHQSRMAGWIHPPEGSSHCILVNSIPKSGTNVLRGIVREIPSTHESSPLSFIYLIQNDKDRFRALRESVRDLGAGCYYTGHLPFSVEADLWLAKMGIRHLLICRDPRAVAVSALYFYMRPANPRHTFHSFLSTLENNEERLTMIIAGKGRGKEEVCFDPPDHFPGLRAFFLAWLPWLERDVHLVRYEEMIHPQGGAALQAQCAILRILDYLHIPPSPELTEKLLQNGMDPTRSKRTFRVGKSSGWEEELTPNHLAILRESASLYARFGYSL